MHAEIDTTRRRFGCGNEKFSMLDFNKKLKLNSKVFAFAFASLHQASAHPLARSQGEK
jgi:hypothetical protein